MPGITENIDQPSQPVSFFCYFTTYSQYFPFNEQSLETQKLLE